MAFSIANLGDDATARALREAAAASREPLRLDADVTRADVLVCTVSRSAVLTAIGEAHRRAPDAQIVLRSPDAEVERLRTHVSFVPDIAGAWVVAASSAPAALAAVLCKAAATAMRRKQARALRKSLNLQIAAASDADDNGTESQRQRQLRRSERYLATLFAQAPQASVGIACGGDVTAWNAAAERICGVAADAALGRPLAEVLPTATAATLLDLAHDTFEHDATASHELELAFAPATIWARVNAAPVHDDGEIICVSVTIRDVSERHRMMARVRASELRYRTLAETIPQLVWTARSDGSAQYFNRQWTDYTGMPPAALVDDGWLDAVHAGDRARTFANWRAAIENDIDYEVEYRLRGADGSYRWFKARGVAIRDEDGTIGEWFGTTTDIDDLVRAREILKRNAADLEATVQHEIRRRSALEDALHRAQKMEALGNLTGGIAHDFNNLLQVIGGNLQLLATRLAGDDDAAHRVASALEGVTQASRLASQLLAFGRRLPLSPKVLNIGRLVRDLDDMLRRSLGERIELETVVGGGLWNALVDRSNIESALVNLAINARDAMEGHGRLTIEVGNAYLDQDYADSHPEVVPGQYVMLAVTDTGCGMPPEVAEKAFEPFFTTKAEGRGTGLGLSMVYGFVKQSHGHIDIYSEPGHGTTFRIYLPRSHASEDVPVAAETRPVHGGSETVLVVEDDDAVRRLAVATLAELGYAVLQARDPNAALAIIESGAAVDLLFTDVVMPGPLKSTELARRARARLPRLAVLYTSGYTRNAIVHGGRLDPGVDLLSKPYSREALARKLRHMLANRAQAAALAPVTAARTPMAAGDASPDFAEPAPPAPRRAVVLLCDDETRIRESLGELLNARGYAVLPAGTAAEALHVAAEHDFDVLVTDVRLPDASGMDLARELLERLPETPVLFASGDTTMLPPDLADARFIVKPFGVETLCNAIEALLARA